MNWKKEQHILIQLNFDIAHITEIKLFIHL